MALFGTVSSHEQVLNTFCNDRVKAVTRLKKPKGGEVLIVDSDTGRNSKLDCNCLLLILIFVFVLAIAG